MNPFGVYSGVQAFFELWLFDQLLGILSGPEVPFLFPAFITRSHMVQTSLIINSAEKHTITGSKPADSAQWGGGTRINFDSLIRKTRKSAVTYL